MKRLTPRSTKRWQRWASAHRLSDARTQELWGILQRPQLPVPDHVVRAKARLMLTLVEEPVFTDRMSHSKASIGAAASR